MHAPRQLQQVSFRLELPTKPGHREVVAIAQGTTPGKRRPLWTEHKVWTNAEADLSVEPADWVHHLALVVLQDAPADQAALTTALTGCQTLPLF